MPKSFMIPPTAWVDKLYKESAKQYFKFYLNYQKRVFPGFHKTLLPLSDKIKNPFVSIEGSLINRRSSKWAQKPQTFKKQMLKTSSESVSFI